MSDITLEQAQRIVVVALEKAAAAKLLPLAITVLDARGAIRAMVSQDGTSLKRGDIAIGKARGALALGQGSRTLFRRVKEQPYFIAAVGQLGELIPVPGGVLIRDAARRVIGAVGISGDTSDNDEACAMAGIHAVGLAADPGED